MALESGVLDPIDTAILGELRRDARISWRELGERVSLSPTSVADRVRRLEDRGIVQGYSAVVDPKALGRTLRAVVDIHLPPTVAPEEFETKLVERDEVIFAAFITGGPDYCVVADCDGPAGLDALIRWMKDEGRVTTVSKVVLRAVVG